MQLRWATRTAPRARDAVRRFAERACSVPAGVLKVRPGLHEGLLRTRCEVRPSLHEGLLCTRREVRPNLFCPRKYVCGTCLSKAPSLIFKGELGLGLGLGLGSAKPHIQVRLPYPSLILRRYDTCIKEYC